MTLIPRVTLAQAAAASATSSAVTVSEAAASALENVEFFGGLDGSKQPQDLGINANMGVRFAVNTGIRLSRRAGLGLQLGAAVNLSDAAVHVLDQIDGTSRRTQRYLTLGLFQQGVSKLSWALSYDYLREHYYDDFSLGQLRGQAGYAVTRRDEVGGMVSTSVKHDRGLIGDTAVTLDPITQVAGYVRRTWPSSARTSAWIGVATNHHNVVLVFPDNSRAGHVVVYGAQLEMPLSDRLSVTGSSNFVTPTSTGTVDAYLGISFYPGRKNAASRGRFAPILPVANNPEFPVDLHR
jgi:hypothetical protein